MSPEEKIAERWVHSVPIVEAILNLIDKARSNTKDNSVHTWAIDYLLSGRDQFITFLSNGAVSMNNNKAEQRIRPIAKARDDSSHSRNLKGARSRAIILSFVLTCVKNGINPY